MTDYAEEQANEIEALQSIYSDEFEEISRDPWSFRITVKSENSTSSNNSDDGKAILLVQFTFGATYPDEPPEIELDTLKAVDEDHLVSIKAALSDAASESIGMVMVYTLVTAVQDRLNSIVDERLQRLREERKRKKEIIDTVEELQETVVAGTPVTKETFAAWKAVFLKEREQANKHKRYTIAGKLTGRQLFDMDASLALSDAAFIDDRDLAVDDEDDYRLETAVEIDESLFQNVNDLQIEDDSD